MTVGACLADRVLDSTTSTLHQAGAYPGAYPCDTPGIQMDGMDTALDIGAGQRLGVASVDTSDPYGSEGCGFESRRARFANCLLTPDACAHLGM